MPTYQRPNVGTFTARSRPTTPSLCPGDHTVRHLSGQSGNSWAQSATSNHSPCTASRSCRLGGN
eukprot:7377761-Prymnesium_polylepis.1